MIVSLKPPLAPERQTKRVRAIVKKPAVNFTDSADPRQKKTQYKEVADN